MNNHWYQAPAAPLNIAAQHEAEARQAQLTKPPGALGQLEGLAVHLAMLQGRAQPRVDKVHITVFAGDHGVAEEGVSAFPQAVTTEMVRNFARGGAAISVLARELGATLEVISLGTVEETGPLPGVRDERLGKSTANFTREAAMNAGQLSRALAVGREAVERARDAGAELYIGGEMGIANTSAASALACALLGANPSLLTGPGTGLNAQGVAHKSEVIERALTLHKAALGDPYESLRCLGGFEIAALAGAYIACAQEGLPALVDGFISSVAALAAIRLNDGTAKWLLLSHASAEPGHAHVVEALDARPLLRLGMRLGEGSGAATTVPLLRLACALHNNMATFAEAGVSEKT